jgi:hypothetical protein
MLHAIVDIKIMIYFPIIIIIKIKKFCLKIIKYINIYHL